MTKTFLIMVVLFISSGCNDLSYADSGKDKMIKAIIGEASNQPEEGRIAVACGVKNRPEGLVGVYGANMSRKPSKQEIINAERALELATPEYCDNLISGADMWENVNAFGHPKGWGAVLAVKQIGDHKFYRRIKQKGE